MKHLLLYTLAAVLAVAVSGLHPASAQNVYPPGPPGYGPYYQTPLSPYLNLLRGGLTAANYYIGTIPEFQRRQDARVFQGQINTALNYSTQTALGGLTAEEAALLRPLDAAGHPTAFGYTGSYFGGAGLGGATGTAVRPAMRQPPQQQRQGPIGATPPINPMTGAGPGGFGR